MIKMFIEKSWLLIVTSLFFGLLLAMTNAVWSERIENNQIEKFNKLARKLVSEDAQFETIKNDDDTEYTVEIDLGKGKVDKVGIKKAIVDDKCAGWAFVCQGSGYADKIELVVVADAKFEKLKGYGVLFSNETPGFGDKIKKTFYMDQFIGAPVKSLTLSKIGDPAEINTEIVAITGATVSSDAVIAILNNYIVQMQTQVQEKGLIE
jgi:electron transport complex protein RnfG